MFKMKWFRRNADRKTTQADARDGRQLGIESLEPRVLLSATWTDAETGDPIPEPTENDDVYTGDNADNTANALGGDDVMSGGGGADTLSGGAGNDTIHGDKHDDTLDGGAGDDQLYGGYHQDTLISGGGNDYMDGGKHDDKFQFTGAQDGDVITVDGGDHDDTIDLSAFSNSQVSDNGSTINVDMGGGQSFTINYTNVENISTSEGTYSPGNVPAGNNAPDAADDSYSTTEDNAVTTGNVLANDADPDGDSLTVTGFTQGANGTVVNNNDGTFTYTPNADFSGTDTFTYTVDDGNGATDTATVNVNVTAQNDAPDAVNDSYSTTENNGVTTGNVLANDTDPDGDSLTVTGFTQGVNGTVVNNNDGTFTYTPNADFSGTDTFTYTVDDGNGATDTATVNVNVTAVEDPEIVTPPSAPPSSPEDTEDPIPAEDQLEQEDDSLADSQPSTEANLNIDESDELTRGQVEESSLNETETIVQDTEDEANLEDYVQISQADDHSDPHTLPLSDRSPNGASIAKTASGGANDPDIFDMIMRGGGRSVPEFGDAHAETAFEDEAATPELRPPEAQAWDFDEMEVVELAPELPEPDETAFESGGVDSVAMDRFEAMNIGGGADARAPEWNPEDAHKNEGADPQSSMEETGFEEDVDADSGFMDQPESTVVQGVFPKLWTALAGIVGATHGPNSGKPADEEKFVGHRR